MLVGVVVTLVLLTVSLALEASDRNAVVGDDDGIDEVVVIGIDDESVIVGFVMFLCCVLLSSDMKSNKACCGFKYT